MSPAGRAATTWATLPLILFALGLVAGSAQAGGSLAEPWHVIETPHFRVYHQDATVPIAHEVALMCEQAHAVLAPIFQHVPRRRTDVVLTDHVDSANGSARVVPTNLMRLHAYPPEAESNLGDFDHWMWVLIVHEYTHILHLDTIGGLPDLANRPFGKRFAPNTALPRWFIEGLATWQESAQSSGGRLQSSQFLMYLRMAVLEDNVPTLGQLSGAPQKWPRATGWYLYGSRFFEWLAEEQGIDPIVAFNHHYGRRVLPYGMNLVGREHLEADFPTLWARWLAEQQGRFVAESLALRLEGETSVEQVTFRGERTRVVRAAPDGSPAWLLDDGRGPLRLVINGEERRIERRAETGGVFAFHPDGRHVVLSQRTVVDRYYGFRDLYLMRLEDGAMTRLTHGARARDPDVCPRGERAVFVTPRDGRADLDVLDLTTGEVQRLWRAPDWGQVSRPRFLPDGDRVVFSLHREGGGRNLVLLDLRDGSTVELTDGPGYDVDPVPTADGAFVIFSADRTDRFDLYAVRLADGDVRRLTRVESGLFSPAPVSGEGGELVLWASHYSSLGFDVGRVGLGAGLEELWEGLELAPRAREREVVERAAIDVATIGEPRRHRGLGDTRLHQWTPVLAADHGGAMVGVSAHGADPPERHGWLATVAWDVDAAEPVGQVDYVTRRFHPRFNLGMQRQVLERSRGLFVGSEELPWLEEIWSARFGTGFPFSSLEASQSLNVGWFGELRSPREGPVPAPSPEDLAPEFPGGRRTSALTLSWNWSRVDRSTWSISAERGSAVTVGTRIRLEGIGSDTDGGEVLGTWRHYVRMPWQEHHVLALRLNGGLGVSGTGSRSLFSVGGAQARDLFVSLVDDLPASTLPTRGYRPSLRQGDRYFRVSAEYRLPLADVDAGLSTLPVYFGRLQAVGFVDVADAFRDVWRPLESLVGLGGELRLSSMLGYFQPAGFRAGVAHGLGEDGILDVYLRYGGAW